MKVTARHVRAMYELFRTLPPYNRWKLPDAEFRVTQSRGVYGTYQVLKGRHRITVSRRNVRCFNALAVTVAHEMLHLRQELADSYSDRSMHNRDFIRLAKHVCRVLGFSSKGFT